MRVLLGAVLFDGEGTFSIYHHKGQSSSGSPYDSTALRIEVTNTKIELMEWLVKHFGGQYYSHRRSNLKALYRIRLASKRTDQRREFASGVVTVSGN